MGKLRKILKVGCGALLVMTALGLAGLALLVWHVRRTASPWPDRLPEVRLEPARPFLREADVQPDNAYYYIRQLTNWHATLKIPQDEMLAFHAHGYRPNAYPQLEAWLVTNAPALQLVARAAAQPHAQVVSYTPTNMLFSCLTEVLNIGKILPFRVHRDAWRQDWGAVSHDFHQTLRLAEQLTCGGVLIHALVGISVESIGLSTARELALAPTTPPAVRRALIQALQELETRREPFDEVMRQELRFSRAYLAHWLHQPVDDTKSSLLPDPDEEGAVRELFLHHRTLACLSGSTQSNMTEHLVAIHSHLIRLATMPGATPRQDPALAVLDEKAPSLYQYIFADDPLGRILLLDSFYTWGNAFQSATALLANLRGTQLFLAVCAYRQEHGGQLPQKLEDLVPAYLPQLPDDPFDPTGGTFRYRIEKNRWLIWSLGPNQLDDGGKFNRLDFDERGQHAAQADIIFASDEFQKAHARALVQLEKSLRENSAQEK